MHNFQFKSINLSSLQQFFIKMDCFGCFFCNDDEPINIKVTPINPNPQQSQLHRKLNRTNSVTTTNSTIDSVSPPHQLYNYKTDLEIQNLLKIISQKPLQERKKIQQKFITSNLNQQAEMYAVYHQWTVTYTEYFENNAITQLPQIDNSILLLEDLGQLKPNIYEKKDYFLVNQKIWYFIVKLYGGGPPILITQTYPKLVLKSCGLINPSLFCYINSSLQLLLSIGQFNDYFDKKLYKISGSKKNKKTCNLTSRLIKSYSQRQKNLLDITQFFNCFTDRFPLKQQHDSHQFLRYYLTLVSLFYQLGQELNIESEKKHLEFKSAQESYNHYFQSHNSIIDRIFLGQLKNIVQCENKQCQNRSIYYQQIMQLNMEMQGSKNINDCLKSFFQVESNQQQSELRQKYKCGKCLKESYAKKQYFLSKCPNYLFIHLKRFQNHKSKNPQKIAYPIDLDLQKYTHGSCGNTIYKLLAFIVHKGSINRGHYYTIAKRNKKWNYYNDQRIQLLSEKQIMKEQAYILLYQRV